LVPSDLAVAPDLEQATPLLIFVAALAGTTLKEPATKTVANAVSATLRNM
jgi:hypothetical protein